MLSLALTLWKSTEAYHQGSVWGVLGWLFLALVAAGGLVWLIFVTVENWPKLSRWEKAKHLFAWLIGVNFW